MILTGQDKLIQRLTGLPAKAQKAVLRPVLRDVAKIMQQAIKAGSPSRSGKLKQSWKVRAGKRTRKDVIRMTVVSSFDGYYGSFVELGTHKMRAERTATRAFNSNKEAQKKAAIEMILAGIDKVA